QQSADYNVLAARLGWLPSYPQFNKNSLLFAEEAAQEGKTSEEAIVQHAYEQVVTGEVRAAVEDPGSPENFPKSLFVWRSNLISSSAKGQEYFMKHLLGASDGLLASPNEDEKPEEIVWRDRKSTRLN